VFGLCGHFLDQFVKRNADLLSHYELKAMTDSLTSLKNHSMFFELLQEEISRSQRNAAHQTGASTLSLILLDLDHFKQVNDRFGHLYGDRILIEFSAILQSNIRNYDHACRYGGDEFAIIMPGTNQQQAAAICERIRQQVQSKLVCGDGFLTLSAGIAEYAERGSSRYDIVQFVHKTDQLLYTAKEKGRNRIEITPSECPAV
jgi:diguanylate cyclase (GGDEF)-like protein